MIKQFTLFLCAVLSSFIVLSQTLSTGTIELKSGYSIQFDIVQDSITMTMIGPDSVWMAVGPGVNSGNQMGNQGDDCILYSTIGLEDRNFTGSFTPPNVDENQDWILKSNTVENSVRTIIAKRLKNTSDSNDYIFPTNGSFPILWAMGSNSLDFSMHAGTDRGGVNATLKTVGIENSKKSKESISIYPNPSSNILNLKGIQSNKTVEFYNYFGQRINLNKLNNKNSFDISKLVKGIYLIKIISKNNHFKTINFIKK